MNPKHSSKGARNRVRNRALPALLASCSLAGGLPGTVLAEVPLYDSDPLSVSATVEVGAGYFTTQNTNLGTGRIDAVSGENTGDATWGEAYVEPGIWADYALRGGASLYGGASVVAATTGGDGDALGLTDGGDGNADIESLFLGWRSGDTFAGSLGADAIDLSVGRQEFQVGDGFLIYDGNLDALDQGAFWMAPRGSFGASALLRINTEPMRADVFYLDAGENQDETEIAGVNLEYVSEAWGTLAAMYFTVLDSAAPELWAPRDGADVVSLRASEISLPALPDLTFWGEVVSQTGDGKYGEKDASAWYLEAQYSFSGAPWSPSLSYRYARFSGDSDPNDNTSEDFDPFFYGFSRSWGTWFQGEVAGNYLLFNSNQVNHMLRLSATPNDSMEIGLLFFDFSLDQDNYFGTPVSSDRFGDEFNVYLDWSITDQLSAGAVYGLFRPGQGAQDAFGDDKDFHLFQAFLIYAL